MSVPTSSVANVGTEALALKQAAVAFIPITLVALSLRFYVRIFVVRGFGLDDVALLMGQVSCWWGMTIHS